MYASANHITACNSFNTPLSIRKPQITYHIPGNSPHQFSIAERMYYLKEYGNNSLSFSALQAGMQFFDMPGIGYIAYMEKWGVRHVLADPTCDKKDMEKLLKAFLEDSKSVAFIQISQELAELLHEKFGFYATQMGIETQVDLTTWDLKGKKKQILRTSINQAKKRNITIKENNSTIQSDELNQEWLKSRKLNKKEIRFLVRPMSMEKNGTRKFYAYHEGKVIGLIYFDPIYSQNEVIGYVPNISRFSPEFKQGIFYAIMVTAMETFKTEGIKTLYLGLSSNVVDDEYKDYELKYLKKIFRLTYEHGNSVYNYKGVKFTKSRFCGKERKVYCASKNKFPFFAFAGLYKICNFI